MLAVEEQIKPIGGSAEGAAIIKDRYQKTLEALGYLPDDIERIMNDFGEYVDKNTEILAAQENTYKLIGEQIASNNPNATNALDSDGVIKAVGNAYG